MIVGNTTRPTLYWVLVVIVLVGVVTAWVEDFPGGVAKPVAVYCSDIGAPVVEFLHEIAHGWILQYASLWQCLPGAPWFGIRAGRAFLIAATVAPCTPVNSGRDWFIAFGFGVVHAVKWIFVLMARQFTEIPITGPGQPFEGLNSVCNGPGGAAASRTGYGNSGLGRTMAGSSSRA